MAEKACKDCGQVKSLDEFYRLSEMKDGHLNFCKECKKAYQRGRPYDKDRERWRNQTAKRKAYHAANLKRWRRENPQKMAVQLARRRSRKLNADGDFTVEEFTRLCARGVATGACGAGVRTCCSRPTMSFPFLWGEATWWRTFSLCAAAATRGRTSR